MEIKKIILLSKVFLILTSFLLNGCLIPPSPKYYNYIEVQKNEISNNDIIDITVKNFYLRRLPQNKLDIQSTIMLKNKSNNKLEINNYDFVVSANDLNLEIYIITQNKEGLESEYLQEIILSYKNIKCPIILFQNETVELNVTHIINSNSFSTINDFNTLNYFINLNNQNIDLTFTKLP